MGSHNPHVCECFGGRCWKHLCPVRTINRAIAKQDDVGRPTKGASPSTRASRALMGTLRKRPEIRTWRDDGSHELGPIPEGRIPKLPEA